jgi:hypothetical protein
MKNATVRIVGGAWLFLACVLVGSMLGCQPRDMVQTEVPKQIRQELGLPERIPVSQAAEVREEYAEIMAAKAAALAEEKAAAVRAITAQARAVDKGYAAQMAAIAASREAAMEEFGEAAAVEAAKAAAIAAQTEANIKAALTKFVKAEQRAEEKAAFLTNILSAGLETIAPVAASAVPGLGLALPLLAGIAGLWLKRPGEDKRVAEEKQDSFNKGARETRELIERTLASRAVPNLPIATPEKA